MIYYENDATYLGKYLSLHANDGKSLNSAVLIYLRSLNE